MEQSNELHQRHRAVAIIGSVEGKVGYRKIRVLLNREGWNVSRYLAYRLYQEEVWPCACGAVGDAAQRHSAGSDFVPRLRIRFRVWISSPISWLMDGTFEP